MKEIWKHKLKLTDYQRVKTHVGSKPLCVQMQDGAICVWAITDTDKPTAEREFWIVGTGHKMPGELRYVGTVQDGEFVWHVFTQ